MQIGTYFLQIGAIISNQCTTGSKIILNTKLNCRKNSSIFVSEIITKLHNLKAYYGKLKNNWQPFAASRAGT